MTGREDRPRLLTLAAQDMSAAYHAVLAQELDGVRRGAYAGVYAVKRTDPIGYAIYHRTIETHHLDTIAVDQFHRRAGVGSALLAWICDELRKVGPTMLNAITDASAPEALRFYLRHGFVLAGLVKDEFLPGVTQPTSNGRSDEARVATNARM